MVSLVISHQLGGSCSLIFHDPVTGLSQGYGFITFTSEKSAKDAYRNANKSTLDGHTILVDFERSRVMKNWIPRRLGGGFGGKKESGQLRFGARDRPFREPPSTNRLHISHEQKISDCWTHSVSEKPTRSSSTDHQRYHRQRREEQDRHSSPRRDEKRPRHRHRSRSPPTDRRRHRSRSSSRGRHRDSKSNSHQSSRYHHRDSHRSSTKTSSRHR